MWEISVSGQVVKQTAGVSEVKRGESSPNPAKLRELSRPEVAEQLINSRPDCPEKIVKLEP